MQFFLNRNNDPGWRLALGNLEKQITDVKNADSVPVYISVADNGYISISNDEKNAVITVTPDQQVYGPDKREFLVDVKTDVNVYQVLADPCQTKEVQLLAGMQVFACLPCRCIQGEDTPEQQTVCAGVFSLASISLHSASISVRSARRRIYLNMSPVTLLARVHVTLVFFCSWHASMLDL
jgi:hypothetical protein